MRNRIILFFMAVVSVLPMTAQNRVQSFEGGLAVGGCAPIESYRDGKGQFGPVLSLSARYNIPSTNYSVGLELQSNNIHRHFAIDTPNGIDRVENNNHSGFLVITTDYNFYQGKKVNPFVGAGIGISDNRTIDSYYDTESVNFIFVPRVGVELLYHIRVTCGFTVTRKGYNGFYTTLGFVIGGRPKKS